MIRLGGAEMGSYLANFVGHFIYFVTAKVDKASWHRINILQIRKTCDVYFNKN